LGGTYSGPGVSGGIFTPSNAGSGTWSIQYTYTDNNTCSANNTKTITVNTMPRITGTVNYDKSPYPLKPLGNIFIRLHNSGGTIIDSTTTPSPTGIYWFRCLQSNTSFSVDVSTTRPWGSGCANASDALLVAQYSLGTASLTPIRLKAADVNNTGSINSGDALMIMKRFIGSISSFPAGNWVFDVSSVNPYSVVTTDVSKNILALCVGDVNGSFDPTSKTAPEISLEKEGVKYLNDNQEFELPLKAKNTFTTNAVSL